MEQFASFPRGRIDAPNAAAYALMLRPGAPVYDFPEEAVVERLDPIEGAPLYLAGNSDGSIVTAALVQRAEGEIRVLADFIREGSPSEVVAEVHAEAALLAESGRMTSEVVVDPDQPYKMPLPRAAWRRLPLRWVVPYRHSQVWNNVGLIQAIQGIPQGASAAPERAEEAGRLEITRLLDRRHRGRFALAVSAGATWTCRAFSGGYSRAVDRSGLSAPRPDAGLYRLLSEGIEAFAGVGVASGDGEVIEDQQPVAYTRAGVPYKSAMPERGPRR
jgi:hypothetical protein